MQKRDCVKRRKEANRRIRGETASRLPPKEEEQLEPSCVPAASPSAVLHGQLRVLIKNSYRLPSLIGVIATSSLISLSLATCRRRIQSACHFLCLLIRSFLLREMLLSGEREKSNEQREATTTPEPNAAKRTSC